MFTKLAGDITFSEFEKFCRGFGEGVRVEYKRQIEVKKNMPKIVSSFANTYGGIFVIGAETDEKNKVKFPIRGVPKRGGFEEQILQSALTGIYPAVIPEVIIRDVPNTDNVVVIVRVDESIQAPHAIQNSTRVYIRTGSITQPYELAEVDRIEFMLKRRGDSQTTTRQIIDRIEKRVESYWSTHSPNLTVIARPIFPYRPLISVEEIGNFATEEGFGYHTPRGMRVVGGSIAVTGRNRALYNYWEFNEYGIVYRRRALERQTSKFFNGEQEKNLDFQQFVVTMGELIHNAKLFFEKCEYSGNIEIKAKLQHVFGEKLRFYELYNDFFLRQGSGHIDVDYIDQQQSSDSEVPAFTICLPRDLSEREKFLEVVDEFASQLLWAFNIGRPFEETATKRRELVERILETAGLIERITTTNENA